MPYSSMAVLLGSLTAVMLLRILLPNRWTAGLFAVTAAGLLGFLSQQHGASIAQNWAAARGYAETLVGHRLPAHPPHAWPPQVGQPYPDLQLIDQDGRRTSLAEFTGKVILLEPVGTPCKACIAFAGGHQRGAYQGVLPQHDLRSVHDYADRYGSVDLERADIVLVQVLFYNQSMQAPTPSDVRDWALHFGLERANNHVVLAAEPYLLSPDTRAMIPGFQLIDKDFVLRYDSTGHSPRHDLYTKLLPGIRALCDE